MLVGILSQCYYSNYGLLFLALQETYSVSKFALGWLLSFFYITGFLTSAYIELIYLKLVANQWYAWKFCPGRSALGSATGFLGLRGHIVSSLK